MRRLAILPLLAVVALGGCAQVTQFAGESLGVPVDEVCTTIDDAYESYETMLEKGEVTEQQIESAHADLVAKLEDLADDVGGEIGDVIRSNAEKFADVSGPDSPEAIEAVENLRNSAAAFCD